MKKLSILLHSIIPSFYQKLASKTLGKIELLKDSYLGLEVNTSNSSFKSYKKLAEIYAQMEGHTDNETAFLRDRGEFHITFVSPLEYPKLEDPDNFLKRANEEVSINDIEYLGFGDAHSTNGKNIAYFIVINWPSANKFRTKNGLPLYEFHITLGFVKRLENGKEIGRDVFVKDVFPKDFQGVQTLKGKHSIKFWDSDI